MKECTTLKDLVSITTFSNAYMLHIYSFSHTYTHAGTSIPSEQRHKHSHSGRVLCLCLYAYVADQLLTWPVSKLSNSSKACQPVLKFAARTIIACNYPD